MFLLLLFGVRALRLPPLHSLSKAEIDSLLKSPEYAMDISSITPDSEKETYIGQGSGVNEGTGLGALNSFAKRAMGKILTWKNRPIYDDLWVVIEECLTMIDNRVQLEQCPTWFGPSPHSFGTDDCAGTVAGYRGGKVDWVTTCKFFSTLGFGNMRIDGWLDRSTRAPHLAVHLCIVFNVIFIYINLVPRTNLILDDDYNDLVYGGTLNDIHNQCIEDKAFKPYFSKSHVVKAFMNAPTTLLYTIKYNKKNFEKVRKISQDYTQLWLDMAYDKNPVLLKNIDDKDTQTELLKVDVRTRQFCGRDPDTKNVANIFGIDTTDKLVRTLWGHPDDPIWTDR